MLHSMEVDDIKIAAVLNLLVVIVGLTRELIGLYRENKQEKKNSKHKTKKRSK